MRVLCIIKYVLSNSPSHKRFCKLKMTDRYLWLHVATFTLLFGYTFALNPEVMDVGKYRELKSWKTNTLYEIVPQGQSSYQHNPYLLYLEGSRYDMGYAYGYLLADEINYVYHTFLNHIIGDKWYDEVFIALLGKALDWQWSDFLSKELPQQYKEELQGLSDGATKAGCSLCGQYITRSIVLSNAPGDVKDIIYIIIREWNNSAAEYFNLDLKGVKGLQPFHCSMFAAWGSRTKDQNLFSARNLDWNQDTGINKYKLVLVTRPNDGGFPSVSFTFVGLYTTLAGMSYSGITVHEANLEENEITFSGFPFVLRLRYIMEYAKTTKEGRDLWDSTNNTVGFNHMIASANDAVQYASGDEEAVVAYAMETMYQYTAYFKDNDPREANATYSPSPQSNVLVRIGFPMKEAVWRTNHGYDPKIRSHFEWSQAPSSWSVRRYMFIHDALKDYETSKLPIGYYEAVNITAIVGDKGTTHPYSCDHMPDGTNVLSVTYQPRENIAYAAFESSTGSSWRPAVCSTYLKIDFTDWFMGKKPSTP